MTKRIACFIASAAVLAVPAMAGAGNGDKATGGGKVLLSQDAKASTIAFTAQGTTTSAKGQVQLIDRTNKTKFHGVVDCIEVTNNFAIVGGFRKKGDPTDPTDRFVLRVVDNGEPNRGADMIQFDNQTTAPDTCGDDDADEMPEFSLANGNAQVRDGG